MHEYSIIQALMDRVEAEAAARGATIVHRLHVSLGEVSGVDGGLLASAFEVIRTGTLCARAELLITSIPARWACPRCGAAPAPGAALRCPACDRPAHLASGDEIVLATIEMEVPDHVQ